MRDCIFAFRKYIDMKTIAQTHVPSYKPSIQFDLLSKFFKWCGEQEKNRLGWLALSLAVHGCIITPIVVLTIAMASNNFLLWIAGMAAMGGTLVVNLTAQPTKTTIPTFFLSLVIDLAIVIACVLPLVTQ